ncbi:hypothetical protein BJF92_11810 [Rhizobium rhizosphaerae]|uniref:Transcription regulator PadR N-terminal domain-containing protein n=1 Tax=Xaviernesmea rhizosphaerae TaxID=1672749 RepID=A0A1Q9AN50_9HYPH|nr:PadR family transcriptional regulator [Xaviernesmea rhizosphaerae]OLP56756.1 hypothetical protein BJF92_11810 [Xaviernesmea rhizosphaerae]
MFGFEWVGGRHDRDLLLAIGGRHERQGRHGHPEGRGGRGHGDEGGRFTRLLGQGDLRLLVLLMIEKEPSHGYEIIRQIEAMTGGAYAPSPGVVYPTLTFLEEAGHASAQEDGNKKRFAITDDGKAHLDEHRQRAQELLERLKMAGEHREKRERHDKHEGHRRDGHGHEGRPQAGAPLPPGVDAAMLHLRDVLARKLAEDEKRAGGLVRLLLQMADEVEAGERP